MPKPIFLVGLPESTSQETIRETQIALEKVVEDYYSLVYKGSSEELEFKVFYEKDFDEVKYEELKQIIIDKMNTTLRQHAPTIGDWLRANGYYKKEDSWYSKLGVKKDYKSLIKIYEKNI